MRALLPLLLLAPTAFAQAKPKVAVHPLVLSGIDSKRERAELATLFDAALASDRGVEVVAPEQVEAVLNKLPQMQCEGDAVERCLSDVAAKTGALYALRVELGRALKPGEWRLAAEVVRRDGDVSGKPPIVTFEESKTTRFPLVAKAALQQLLKSLALAQLPPSIPPKVVAVAPQPPPAPPAPADVPPPPPPPPVVEARASGPGGLRVASYLSGGLGVAGLATGAVCAVLASSDRSTLEGSLVKGPDGKALGIPESSRGVASRLDGEQTAATVSLVAGGALLAAGVTMFLLSGSSDAPAVSLAPVPGGGVAVVGGRF